jgi:LuxR family transcriptional regulator, maltose regulon positive regulatory protein
MELPQPRHFAPAAEKREQTEGGDMPSILAAQRSASDDRTAVSHASAPGRDNVVSLIVVRDGVAETFVLGNPARDGLDRAGVSATPLGRVASLAGAAPLSLASSDQFDVVDGPGLGREAGESLLAEIVRLLPDTSMSSRSQPQPFNDELTGAEQRVLRYLPTNLTAWEIAEELYVSLNTVKTHMRHIYAKLGAHRRREAVERARGFGLLAPSSHLRSAHQALA